EPTTDLLPVTFRNVLILDTTYQLKDIVVKALHETIDLTKAPELTMPTPAKAQNDGRIQRDKRARGLSVGPIPGPGTGRVALSTTEIIDIYGHQSLRKLKDEISEDEKDWYRHDPSVLTWLLGELTTAYNFIRDETRRGNPMFQAAVIHDLGEFA